MRLSGWIIAVAIFVGVTALASAGMAHATVALKLTTPISPVAAGDTIVIQAVVAAEDSTALFNAFDLVVRFDPALVTFVPQAPVASQLGSLITNACGNVFHVFNAASDSTLADVSLLCNQTFVTGPGTIYQLKFKSNGTTGGAKFSVGRGTRFISAGVYVTPVLTQGVSVVVGTSVLAVPGAKSLPRDYILEAPRPNPWREGATARVNFTLPRAASVELALFDMQGRKVAGLAVGDVPVGASSVRWDSPGLPAGRYDLRLRADGRVVARQAWVLLQ